MVVRGGWVGEGKEQNVMKKMSVSNITIWIRFAHGDSFPVTLHPNAKLGVNQ